MSARRVRVVSAGHGSGTKVYLDGEDITESVRAVTWRCEAGGLAKVELEFLGDVDVELEAEIEEEPDGLRAGFARFMDMARRKIEAGGNAKRA